MVHDRQPHTANCLPTALVVGEKSGGHFEEARCEGESAPGFFSVSKDHRSASLAASIDGNSERSTVQRQC